MPGAGGDGVRAVDGYTVHMLGQDRFLGYPRAVKLGGAQARRDLARRRLHTSVAVGWLPLQAGVGSACGREVTGSSPGVTRRRPSSRWRGCGVPGSRRAGLRSVATRWIPGRLVSLLTELCYAPTSDCGEIAWRFFGVQREKYTSCIWAWTRTCSTRCPATSERGERDGGDLRARAGVRARGRRLSLHRQDDGGQERPDRREGRRAPAGPRPALRRAVRRWRRAARPHRRAALRAGCSGTSCRTGSSVATTGLRTLVSGRPPRAPRCSTRRPARCLSSSVDRIYRDHVEGNGATYRQDDLDDLVSVLEPLSDAGLRSETGSRRRREDGRAVQLDDHRCEPAAGLRQASKGRTSQ